MTNSRNATKKSSKLWVAWLALIVAFVIAATLAVAKPWLPDAVASPAPSSSITPSPSSSPSPVALTADTAVIANPAGLTWTGDYTRDKDTGAETGYFPPFIPDGDYPGTLHEVESDDSVPTTVKGAAPPWFPDMTAFSFTHGEAKGVGDGVSMDAYLVDGGFLKSAAANGTPTAWIVAAFNTDQHSKEPRWAICRFHLTGDDSAAAVDGIYCDQAEAGPVGDTWDFYDYAWRLDGDTLLEWRASSYEQRELGDESAPRTFTVGGGPGGLALDGEFGATGSGPTASWKPADVGMRVPTEAEVGEANDCLVGDDGQILHCPES